MKTIFQVTITVRDYDEAISFYTQALGFELLEDTKLSESKRWVRVAPNRFSQGASLLLAKAADEKQISSVGNQTGGRVFLFMHTDDLDRDLERALKHGAKLVRGPVSEVYGKVAVIEDLYGNKIDIIQPPV